MGVGHPNTPTLIFIHYVFAIAFFPIYVLLGIQNCIKHHMYYDLCNICIEPLFLYKCICGNRYIIGIFLICKTAIMAFACAFHAFFQNKYYILITRFKFFTYTCTVVFSSLLIRKKYITLSAYMTILSFFESDQNVLWLTNALIDCMNYFVQRSINRQIS